MNTRDARMRDMRVRGTAIGRLALALAAPALAAAILACAGDEPIEEAPVVQAASPVVDSAARPADDTLRDGPR